MLTETFQSVSDILSKVTLCDLIFFQGKTIETYWLVSKDTSAKAKKVPRAAMSVDSQAMEGNVAVGGDYVSGRGYRPVVLKPGKVETSKRSCFNPEAARLSFIGRLISFQNPRPFVSSVYKIESLKHDHSLSVNSSGRHREATNIVYNNRLSAENDKSGKVTNVTKQTVASELPEREEVFSSKSNQQNS